MTSKRAIQANQGNAQHSTGPHDTSATSLNAIKHGMLSQRLFLEDENPDDFYALLEELKADLRPIGRVEEFIVQRIAFTIWRQWRLMRAETAQTELERQDGSEAMRAEAGRVLKKNKSRLYAEDFQPLPKGEEQNLLAYQSFLEEYHQNKSRLSQYSDTNLPALEQDMPTIYATLELAASLEGKGIPAILQAHTNFLMTGQSVLETWIKRIAEGYQQEVARLLPRQQLSRLVGTLRQSLAIPQRSALVARYQTALDNQLYRALKELERVQKWRRESIDQGTEQDGGTSLTGQQAAEHPAAPAGQPTDGGHAGPITLAADDPPDNGLSPEDEQAD